jgi:hypothetical protein
MKRVMTVKRAGQGGVGLLEPTRVTAHALKCGELPIAYVSSVS